MIYYIHLVYEQDGEHELLCENLVSIFHDEQALTTHSSTGCFLVNKPSLDSEKFYSIAIYSLSISRSFSCHDYEFVVNKSKLNCLYVFADSIPCELHI